MADSTKKVDTAALRARLRSSQPSVKTIRDNVVRVTGGAPAKVVKGSITINAGQKIRLA